MHMCVCVLIRASLQPLTPDPRSAEVQGGAAGSLHPDVPRLSWGAADTRRRACGGQHRQPGEEKLVSVREYGLLLQHFSGTSVIFLCNHTQLYLTETGWLKHPFDSVSCEE